MAKQQQPKQEEQQKNDATQKKTEQPAAAKPKKSKIGEGTLKAWIRQGGKEVDQVWAAFRRIAACKLFRSRGISGIRLRWMFPTKRGPRNELQRCETT